MNRPLVSIDGDKIDRRKATLPIGDFLHAAKVGDKAMIHERDNFLACTITRATKTQLTATVNYKSGPVSTRFTRSCGREVGASEWGTGGRSLHPYDQDLISKSRARRELIAAFSDFRSAACALMAESLPVERMRELTAEFKAAVAKQAGE
jgi:hypothetical protein